MSKMPVFLEIPGIARAYNIEHIQSFYTEEVEDFYQLWMKLTSGKRMCILNVVANKDGIKFVEHNKNKIKDKIKLLREEL